MEGSRSPRVAGILPVLAAAVALAAALPAASAEAARRPAKTEESPLVPPGTVRISAGWETADVTADLDATAEVAAVTAGLSASTDLTLSGSYLHLTTSAGRAVGWGDPLATMRARIAVERGSRPAIDFTLGVKFPSGDHRKNLGTEETDFVSYVGLHRHLGATSLHANVGATIVGLVHRPHEQDDSFLFGLLVERRLTANASLLLDWFGESKTNIRRNPFSYHVRHDQAVLAALRVDALSVTWDAGFMKPVAGDTYGWGFTIGATREVRFLRD